MSYPNTWALAHEGREKQTITVSADENAAPVILEAIHSYVESIAPEFVNADNGPPDEWHELLNELERHRDEAAGFDPNYGFSYPLPTGEVITVDLTA